MKKIALFTLLLHCYYVISKQKEVHDDRGRTYGKYR